MLRRKIGQCTGKRGEHHFALQVRARSAGVNGPAATGMIMTKEDIPGLIAGIEFSGNATDDSFTVTWIPPVEPNGIIIQYTLVN